MTFYLCGKKLLVTIYNSTIQCIVIKLYAYVKIFKNKFLLCLCSQAEHFGLNIAHFMIFRHF